MWVYMSFSSINMHKKWIIHPNAQKAAILFGHGPSRLEWRLLRFTLLPFMPMSANIMGIFLCYIPAPLENHKHRKSNIFNDTIFKKIPTIMAVSHHSDVWFSRGAGMKMLPQFWRTAVLKNAIHGLYIGLHRCKKWIFLPTCFYTCTQNKGKQRGKEVKRRCIGNEENWKNEHYSDTVRVG